MTPRETLNSLTAAQKVVAALGSSAAAVVVVAMFLYAPVRQGTAFEAKLEAHAADTQQITAMMPDLVRRSEDQTKLLQTLISLEQENVKANERTVFLLRLLCEDQVDDKLKKLCR